MGLGRRTFAPGEVLTASNVMNYLQDQAVMNFAGTAARGSAIGTALSEGMVSYLNDTDRFEVYNGTAWAPLAYASAVPTLAGVGLVPIIPTSLTPTGGTASFNSNTGTITMGAGMTAINVSGIFTSAYKNYLVIVEVLKDANASNSNFTAQLLSGATPLTSGYVTANIGIASSNSAIQNLGTADRFYVTRTYQASRRSMGTLTFSSPFLSQATTVSGTGYGTTLGDEQGLVMTGTVNNTTSYDGLRFLTSVNAVSGTINVYGFKDS